MMWYLDISNFTYTFIWKVLYLHLNPYKYSNKSYLLLKLELKIYSKLEKKVH